MQYTVFQFWRSLQTVSALAINSWRSQLCFLMTILSKQRISSVANLSNIWFLREITFRKFKVSNNVILTIFISVSPINELSGKHENVPIESSVWKFSQFLCHSDFTWNQLLWFCSVKICYFDSFSPSKV